MNKLQLLLRWHSSQQPAKPACSEPLPRPAQPNPRNCDSTASSSNINSFTHQFQSVIVAAARHCVDGTPRPVQLPYPGPRPPPNLRGLIALRCLCCALPCLWISEAKLPSTTLPRPFHAQDLKCCWVLASRSIIHPRFLPPPSLTSSEQENPAVKLAVSRSGSCVSPNPDLMRHTTSAQPPTPHNGLLFCSVSL